MSGLSEETRALAVDYLSTCCTGPSLAPPPPSESAAAMRHLAKDLEMEYQARFLSMAQTFLELCGPDPCPSLRKVMEELVGDGHLNWGRVVSLFTFTGVMVRLLLEQKGINPGLDSGQGLGEMSGICRELAETIADYLGVEKKDWLLDNDGWVGLYCVCSYSDTVDKFGLY